MTVLAGRNARPELPMGRFGRRGILHAAAARNGTRRTPLNPNQTGGPATGPPAGAERSGAGEPLPTRDLDRCLLCGADDLEGEPFAYSFSGVEFPGVRCPSCGLVFLRRQPTGRGIARLYDAEYFQSDYHCGHEDRPYFATESEQTEASSVLLDWIAAAVPKGRLLEVGCAGGYFLQTARDRGWQVTGVEISSAAAAFARDHLGLEVRTGSLEEARFESASFDAAFLGDVLEHVPEPLQTLAELHRVLRPGAALLLAGPITINSLDRRLGLGLYRTLGKTKVLRQPPYHLTEFTPATQRAALEGAGFRVQWLRQSKIRPRWRNVRHRHPAEHVAKLLSDSLNWVATSLTGRLGDRFVALSLRGE